MNRQKHPTSRWRLVVGVILWMGGFCAPTGAEVAEYLQDDVRITGDQIHYFQDNGRMVSVVTGRFRMVVGPRVLSGRKAVIWIDTKTSDAATLHDLTVYIEDDAGVVEADGTTTQDKLMLVRLHVQGRITAEGSVSISKKSLHGLPLYQRAVQTRQDEQDMLQAWREKVLRRGLPDRSELPLVVRPSAPEPSPQPQADDAAPETPKSQPLGLEDLASDDTDATGDQVSQRLSASMPATTPSPPTTLAAAAVHFEAPEGVTIEKDPKDPHRRITIAKGKVYLSQGTRKSNDFLELRADSAVLFSRDDVKKEEDPYEKVPYAPKLIGGSGGGETVTGAYLEGDVIISRGERKMTGRAAYYDFVNERAVILEPVFRTIQEQRNIPIYIRAARARVLSPREMKFYNAIVSTSDFKTPTYAIGAKEVLLRDETPYDTEGEEIGRRRYSTKYKQGHFDVRGFPVAYLLSGQGSFEEGHTALRKVTAGKMGHLGWGAESEWHLFRLLGLVKPEGVDARLQASAYEKGVVVGIEGDYEREEESRQYSGYFNATGVYDRKAEDTFGDERRDIEAQHNRGRVLVRHKEFLPHDWQVQAELSLLSDRNFMEEYFPDEFWTGKEQENLIYAKKQRDNWAITALLKAKLNRFLTQTESFPEVAGYLVGESFLQDHLTYFGEARLGAERYNEDTQDPLEVRSPVLARFDTRHEVDLPLEAQTPWGPLNIVPYATGRFTVWSDSPSEDEIARIYNPDGYGNANWRTDDGGSQTRILGEGGVRTNMHFWKVYPNVESRLWDVHQIKHILTPELVAFGRAMNDVYPDELYPLSPNVEPVERVQAAVYGALRQRWQTKRGPVGQRRTVDWMRLNIAGGYFDTQESDLRKNHISRAPYLYPRFFMTHTEYSTPRSFLSADYTWNVSDSVAILADTTFDLEEGQCATANVGLAVQRDPRLSYYTSLRYINELDSAVGTIGVKYKINKKYTIAALEQFDFAYDGGVNLGTRVSIIRRFPRWYVGVTFLYDRRYEGDDQIGVALALWPEGVPEARLGGMRNNLINTSTDN